MADNVKNFCKVEVSGYYGTSETSIVLKPGEGAKLPTPPFNLVWWNATDYQDPSDDPYREIVRVTAVSGDTITVLRGQEDTIAQPHNIPGKVYKMIRAITAKDYEDLQKIEVYKDGIFVASRPRIDFKGGEVSDDILNNKVNVFLTGNFAPRATNPPSLQLYVSRGQVIIEGVYVFFSGGNSPSFTIPTNYPRIDLLCLNSSGNLEIVQGTESATPSTPNYPLDKFVICGVYNRPGQTCIKDSDDGVNGYIYRDVRAFIGAHPNVISLVAGESLPVGAPVYVASNGKIYGCDASCLTTSNFIGFTLASCSENSLVPVIVGGIANLFSSLNPSRVYYVQGRNYYVDQSQTNSNTNSGTYPLWQSFTPSQSKFYGASIFLYCNSSSTQSGQIDFRIYSGEGTGGTLLASGTTSITISSYSLVWVNLILEYPISLTPGQRYTLWVNSSNTYLQWRFYNSDVYSGGRASSDPSYDFCFKTFYNAYPPSIGTSPGTNSVKVGIAVSSTALKITT